MPDCPYYKVGSKFTSSFSEKTFSDTDNKRFRIGDLQVFFLFCTQQL